MTTMVASTSFPIFCSLKNFGNTCVILYMKPCYKSQDISMKFAEFVLKNIENERTPKTWSDHNNWKDNSL